MMMDDTLFRGMMQKRFPGIFTTFPLQKCNSPFFTTYITIAVNNEM
jgi:hypothetical protein